MTNFPVHICPVDTPEGTRYYITPLDLEIIFSHGLPAQAIIGSLKRAPTANQSVAPEIFVGNSVFVDFMHDTIARRGPSLPGMIVEAKRQRTGWIYIIDQRTPTPDDGVPPEDIVGVFAAKDGIVELDSYRRNPNHQLLTNHGFFQLGAELHPCLLEELTQLAKSATST